MKNSSMRLAVWTIGFIQFCLPAHIHAAITGANWTQATAGAAFPGRYCAQVVSFQNKMFLIGGGTPTSDFNDVWTSTNGKDWTQVMVTKPFTARRGHVCLVFSNKIYLMGGNNEMQEDYHDVWSSPDGKEWTCLTANCSVLQNRNWKFATVFKNKIWLVGGTQDSKLNKVYSSTNGTSWTLEQDAPAFTALNSSTCIAFNNKLWLIGGCVGSAGFYNFTDEVWNSPDGKTWTKTNPTHIFSARAVVTSCVFDNKLWAIGGVGNTTGMVDYYSNDVWYTIDGSDWIQATAHADYSKRLSVAGVVFDNKMWIISGRDASSCRNDAWYSSVIKNDVLPGAWLSYQ
ncbi:MAG: hypothetical protein ABFD69_01320 [Candidatus Sumerlaeia bacterium]